MTARDPSKISPQHWTDGDLACICANCGHRYGHHSGEHDRCPMQVGTVYKHDGGLDTQVDELRLRLQALLDLHVAHHNHPHHAAAREALRRTL